jgi:hypothetical protein
MTPPKTKFIEELYDESQIHHIVSEFQKKGCSILPNVFERESVKEFKAQLEEIMYFNGNAYTIPDNSPHYIHSALPPHSKSFYPKCSKYMEKMKSLTLYFLRSKNES